MSDETTLLSCPFCGGEAYTCVDHEETHIPVLQHLVQCGCCWATTDKYDTEAEAIDAWNTRAHGTLTAEQVREAIERNFGKVAVLDDGKPVEWRDDWVCRVGINYQAIADELNACITHGKPFTDAIADLRKTVREAFSGESVSLLVEGYSIMRAIDAVENAELGSETCEDVSTKYGTFICSECGCEVDETGVDYGCVNFCPDCGKVVER